MRGPHMPVPVPPAFPLASGDNRSYGGGAGPAACPYPRESDLAAARRGAGPGVPAPTVEGPGGPPSTAVHMPPGLDSHQEASRVAPACAVDGGRKSVRRRGAARSPAGVNPPSAGGAAEAATAGGGRRGPSKRAAATAAAGVDNGRCPEGKKPRRAPRAREL